MELNSFIKLNDIIEYEINRKPKDRYSSDSYCVYWENKNDEHPKVDDFIFIGDYPQIIEEEDYKEVFPQEVVNKGWWLLYRDELIQDVIDNVLFQNSKASIEQINEAIVFYCKNDSFMVFSGT